MRKLPLFLGAYLATACFCFGQGLFDRLPEAPEHFSILLFGYHGDVNNISEFASASIFDAPVTTPTAANTSPSAWVCAVTALHCLKDQRTGQPFDGILLKLNMPPDSKSRYIKVPLKNDEPKNYWVSPSGLDLAVIPLPKEAIDGADVRTFSEDHIVTPTTAQDAGIVPGLLAEVICQQLEYFDLPLDSARPETRPIVRLGHLARLGFYQDALGISVRPHVIDVHASHGNSGAPVVVFVPRKDLSVSDPMLLGIVASFPEELGAYDPYQIPITNTAAYEPPLELVSAQSATNFVGTGIKTEANPNLTSVTPVHELIGLRDSREFQNAVQWLALNRQRYVIMNGVMLSVRR